MRRSLFLLLGLICQCIIFDTNTSGNISDSNIREIEEILKAQIRPNNQDLPQNNHQKFLNNILTSLKNLRKLHIELTIPYKDRLEALLVSQYKIKFASLGENISFVGGNHTGNKITIKKIEFFKIL